MLVGGLLSVTEIDGRPGWWALDRPLHVHTQRGQITVPVGFETDFASVPRAFWSVFPPYGHFTKAAVVHDFLYGTTDHKLTREEADRVFLEIMTGGRTALWRAYLMYRAVRWFGGPRWAKGESAKE